MDVVRSPEHLKLSDQLGAESMTLLLNRQNFLPLDKAKIKSVAVIGPAAGDDYETGNYYGTPFRKVSVVRGSRILPRQWRKSRVRKRRRLHRSTRPQGHRAAPPISPARATSSSSASAPISASKPKAAIAATSISPAHRSSSSKPSTPPTRRPSSCLRTPARSPSPGPTIISPPSSLPGIPAKAAATPSPARSSAINNPGGHLPYTVYQSLDGVPPQNEYDVTKGYTYMYFKGLPLYPFGHGLSYTTFSYSNLKVTQNRCAKLTVTFDLKNSGDRAGAEVAQLYTHQRTSSTYQPIKSLRAFQRVTLDPGRIEDRHARDSRQATRLLRRQDPRLPRRARHLRRPRRLLVRRHPSSRRDQRKDRTPRTTRTGEELTCSTAPSTPLPPHHCSTKPCHFDRSRTAPPSCAVEKPRIYNCSNHHHSQRQTTKLAYRLFLCARTILRNHSASKRAARLQTRR